MYSVKFLYMISNNGNSNYVYSVRYRLNIIYKIIINIYKFFFNINSNIIVLIVLIFLYLMINFFLVRGLYLLIKIVFI